MKKTLLILSCLSVLLSCKKPVKRLQKITAKTIKVDSTTKNTPAIDKFISPYKDSLEVAINTVLTKSVKDIVRTDGEMQSSLGNLMADLCYDIANPIFREKTQKNIDFSMFNYGGIRAGLPKGNITNKHAFQLMPFENSLVVAELSSEKVKELVHYFISNKKAHPLSKQINLTIENDKGTLLINSKPLDDKKTYYVLTSDYLQGGGDKMDFFKNPKSLTKLDYKVRDAIINYFKSVQELNPQLDQRVVLK